MTIIKHLSRNWLKILVLSLLFNSCNSKKSIAIQKDSRCIIREMELTEFKISAKDSNVANLEFENFFNSINKYDILMYAGKGGELDYKIHRWILKSKNLFDHISITNGQKSVTEISINESDIKSLINKLQSNSYFKICGNCFDCENGLLLIKSDELFFKYHYDGLLYKDLNDVEKNKIIQAIDVLNFLNR